MADNKDEEGKEGGEAAAVAPKKSKKMLFIIGGVVLLLLAIGVPLAIFLGKDKKVDDSKSAEKVSVDVAKVDIHKLSKEAEEEVEGGEEIFGAIAPLDAFVVNLKGGRFIRMQMQIEFVERDVPARLAQRAAIIRDAVITLLTTKTADDVMDREGKERLRKDLRILINEALRKELVKQIYFTQFVVQ